MKTARVKVRPLAPAEEKVLVLARAAIVPMCDLFRMVPLEDWSPTTLGADGEMRKRFFEAEEALKKLGGGAPKEEPARKPLFAEDERMHLGARGYTPEDIAKIRNIAARLVEGQVLKGTLNPEDEQALKKAVKQAGRDALSAYNAALEFVSG